MALSLILINTSVMSSTNRIILPWTILQLTEENITILQFFSITVRSRISEYDCELLSVHVGHDMNSLYHVPDTSLPVVAVINSFGRFLRYNVTVAVTESANEQASTFHTVSLFVQPVNERTKKHRLFNDIAKFLTSSSASFTESEIPMGKQLVNLLRDIFWHIDGHHHVFDQRALPIPPIFHSFTGYNTPELSKHRKRLTRNLSSDSLREFSLELSTNLNYQFWDRPHWSELKPHFLLLLQSLSSYSDYLVRKNKRAMSDQRSLTPIREVAD